MGGRAEAAEDRGVSLYWLLTVPRPSQAAQLHEELLLGGAAGPRLLLIVDVEADGLLGVDAEPLLDHLPYPKYGVWLRGVGQPHGELVTLPPHVNHSSVHLNNQI